MKRYFFCCAMLFTAFCLYGCGAVVINADLTSEKFITPPSNVKVADNRATKGMTTGGVVAWNTSQIINLKPSAAYIARSIIGQYFLDIDQNDNITISIIQLNCSIHHTLIVADIVHEFKLEIEFVIDGKLYVKTYMSGDFQENVSAGWGLNVAEICPDILIKDLHILGSKMRTDYDLIKDVY